MKQARLTNKMTFLTVVLSAFTIISACGSSGLSKKRDSHIEDISPLNASLTEGEHISKKVTWSSSSTLNFGQPKLCVDFVGADQKEQWDIKVVRKEPIGRCRSRDMFKACQRKWYDHEVLCYLTKK